jgi:hypothetical protein
LWARTEKAIDDATAAVPQAARDAQTELAALAGRYQAGRAACAELFGQGRLPMPVELERADQLDAAAMELQRRELLGPALAARRWAAIEVRRLQDQGRLLLLDRLDAADRQARAAAIKARASYPASGEPGAVEPPSELARGLEALERAAAIRASNPWSALEQFTRAAQQLAVASTMRAELERQASEAADQALSQAYAAIDAARKAGVAPDALAAVERQFERAVQAVAARHWLPVVSELRSVTSMANKLASDVARAQHINIDRDRQQLGIRLDQASGLSNELARLASARRQGGSGVLSAAELDKARVGLDQARRTAVDAQQQQAYDLGLEKLGPAVIAAAEQAARQAYSIRDFAASERWFSLQIEMGNDTATTRFNRSLTYFERQLLKPAIEDLDRAIVLDPKHAWAHVMRGRAHRMNWAQDLALRDLRRAAELDTQVAYTAWREIGELHAERKEAMLAIDAYRRALELAPQSDRALIEQRLRALGAR